MQRCGFDTPFAKTAQSYSTTIMDKEYKRTQPVAESFLLIYFPFFLITYYSSHIPYPPFLC